MESVKTELKEVYASDFVICAFDETSKSLIVTATKNLIPAASFRELFGQELTKLISQYKAEQMVFDKRNLKVFDQASMIWYHVEWKEKVKSMGIKSHAKLLPQDAVFRKSVEIGKQKIKEQHPDFDFGRYQIRYFESLEEALAR